MNRLRISAAGILVVMSLVPTGVYVSILLGSGEAPVHLQEIRSGIWITRIMLFVHAVMLIALPRDLAAPGHLLASHPSERSSSAEWRLLLALLVMGIVLRGHELGTGLWYDEIETLVEYARLPLGSIVTTFDSQNQHLLYSVASSAAIHLFGESGWALRLPAAIFGVLSVGALWWFGRTVTNHREALLATALLTFSYHHVWFSQNARGYTALLFWSLLGTGYFIALLRNERTGWMNPVLYGLVMALAIYTHVTAVLVVGAHVLVLIVLWLRQPAMNKAAARPAFWGIVFATSMTLLLYAPVLPQFLRTLLQPSHAVDTAWKDPFWLLLETLRGLAAGLPGGWIALAGAIVVAVAGLLSYWKQSPVLVGLFILPALLTGAVALGLGHNLWPRFFFFSAGFAVLVAIRGVFTVVRLVRVPRAELAATLACGVLILGSAVTLRRAWLPKQDYLAAADFVRGAEQAGDAVVVVDLTNYPYRHYLQKPWTLVDNVGDLRQIEQQHARTWVLYTFPIRLAAAHPDIWSRIQSDYTTQAVFPGTVGGGAIVVMVNRSAPPPQRTPA
jgi:hypothetical protein